MPTYRIFEQCTIDLIYEIEAASREEAQKSWTDRDCCDELIFVGESDYEPTGIMEIEVLCRDS